MGWSLDAGQQIIGSRIHIRLQNAVHRMADRRVVRAMTLFRILVLAAIAALAFSAATPRTAERQAAAARVISE